ncbi:MAG: histidinol phosphatase, partial [Verrucomicrobia bacterium]|nr:histidinol phosphatase [Verrucomicrobiota bacterium]
TLKEFKLNWFTRPLARLCFGRLEPDRKLFHVQLDPYERSARFVNTHILARELSEPAILDSLREGRVFIGFDMIADSSGFRWLARNEHGSAVMGETLAFSNETRLQALSPLPCRFTVLKDGGLVHREEGRELEWTPSRPGKYRVEAEVSLRGNWVPWVYANPIELK